MALPPVPNLRPYLAPLLLRSADGANDQTFLERLYQEACQIIAPPIGGPRTILEAFEDERGALRSYVVEYRTESTPAWAPDRHVDTSHHLLAISVKGNLAAVCASENSLRDKLRRLLNDRPIARAEIEAAFVGNQARALWLSGIHTSTDAKADAKTLMGPALEYAIDPLGDQSYAYTAVRSRVALTLSSGLNDPTIGAAPDDGRLWLYRPANWSDYAADVESLIDAVVAPAGNATPFPMLATHVTDLSPVQDAHAVAIVPAELMRDDVDSLLHDLAIRWAYEGTFTVAPEAGAALTATVQIDGVLLGDLAITPTMNGDKVEFGYAWSPLPTAAAGSLRDEFNDVLGDHDWLKIYYDSGHTIARGRCYVSAYRDQWFPDWQFEDLTGYDIQREKPALTGGRDLAASIGQPKANGAPDDSLFAFCLQRFGSSGHLACDDGSMELADFVHIADDDTVTLIHAKAAHSGSPNREASTSPYEVVAGQAIKNLRHLDRTALATALERSATHAIAAATWEDGIKVADRTAIIARATILPPGHRRRVVILQPHLTETEHDDCQAATAGPARLHRMKQLNTLLLSARLSANAVGSEIEVWGTHP
jgi:hypothetical protein